MSLDIQEGDILVYGGNEYPIRAIGAWEWYGPTSLAMRRQMRQTCSTKRVPAMVNGKRGAAVAKLSNVACTPLDPADVGWRGEVMKSDPRLAQLRATAVLLETTVDDGERFLRLMVEEVK